MSWLHAHFSDDYALHAIFSFDETSGGRDLSADPRLRAEGRRGARAGRRVGHTMRDDEFFARQVELSVVDATGAVHELTRQRR